MIRIFENSPENQPQNFYMGRDAGELRSIFDTDGVPRLLLCCEIILFK